MVSQAMDTDDLRERRFQTRQNCEENCRLLLVFDVILTCYIDNKYWHLWSHRNCANGILATELSSHGIRVNRITRIFVIEHSADFQQFS